MQACGVIKAICTIATILLLETLQSRFLCYPQGEDTRKLYVAFQIIGLLLHFQYTSCVLGFEIAAHAACDGQGLVQHQEGAFLSRCFVCSPVIQTLSDTAICCDAAGALNVGCSAKGIEMLLVL